MDATPSKIEAVELGERLRDVGVLRATKKKERHEPVELLLAEWRFLDSLLRNGTATADATVEDLNAKHDDGGYWLGGIFIRLSRQGLIVDVGSERSCRSSRHRCKQTLWGIGNREAVENRLRLLKERLDKLNSDGTVLAGVTAETTLNTNDNPFTKGLDNGQAI